MYDKAINQIHPYIELSYNECITCVLLRGHQIIGRVSADPDYLPRRSDFGLNEAAFVDKFCLGAGCPEPFYRVAFLACHLDPDTRYQSTINVVFMRFHDIFFIINT